MEPLNEALERFFRVLCLTQALVVVRHVLGKDAGVVFVDMLDQLEVHIRSISCVRIFQRGEVWDVEG